MRLLPVLTALIVAVNLGRPVIFRQEQAEIIEKAVGPPAASQQQAEVS